MSSHHLGYESMVRRAEHIIKAVSGTTTGRGRLAVTSRALLASVDEAHERMNLAWTVLRDLHFDVPRYHTYRLQKAAELSACYILICKVYDELCAGNVIAKDQQTEPTTAMLAREAKEDERDVRRKREAARLA